MLVSVVALLGGFSLLFGGGELLVRGSVAMGLHLRISTLLISMVIVGFGTSMPERLVCVQAALDHLPDIALGAVIGSNIANILLILGIAALVRPLDTASPIIRRDTLAVLAASAIFCALTFLDEIDRLAGAGMLLLLTAYLWWCYWQERQGSWWAKKDHGKEAAAAFDSAKIPMWRAFLYVFGGLILLAAGAHWLVSGAVDIAYAFGISEAVIGLSLIALGTSLPELITGVVASIHRHSDVVIGNVLGSNLFNIMATIGIVALVTPVPLTGAIVTRDVWIMLAVAALLLPVMLLGKRHISRLEGAGFLVLYMAYMAWLFVA